MFGYRRHEPNQENNVGDSKAVGEPPFMLVISVWEVVRDAIANARGDGQVVRMDAPATPERILTALMSLKQQAAYKM
jgi:xanthine dehydrogenase large subunit